MQESKDFTIGVPDLAPHTNPTATDWRQTCATTNTFHYVKRVESRTPLLGKSLGSVPFVRFRTADSIIAQAAAF
jgi:hypothetical protein